MGSIDDKKKYYYKGDELKTNQSIIGCVLMQPEIVLIQ